MSGSERLLPSYFDCETNDEPLKLNSVSTDVAFSSTPTEAAVKASREASSERSASIEKSEESELDEERRLEEGESTGRQRQLLVDVVSELSAAADSETASIGGCA